MRVLPRRPQVRAADVARVLDAMRLRRSAALARAEAQGPAWRARLLREKAVAHALNCLHYDSSRKCLLGEGWVAASRLEATRAALRRAGLRAGAHAPPYLHLVDPSADGGGLGGLGAGGGGLGYGGGRPEKAPSFFAPSPLLAPFQAIVDACARARAPCAVAARAAGRAVFALGPGAFSRLPPPPPWCTVVTPCPRGLALPAPAHPPLRPAPGRRYGVARADELNPAPFVAVTFPFFFGLMFGDVGHGLLLIAFSLSYILREDKLKRRERAMSELEGYPWHGRYVMLLMGICAT